MLVKVGCEFGYSATFPVAAVTQVEPRPDGPHRVISATWGTSPDVDVRTYTDLFGNPCRRFTIAPGAFRMRYDALTEVADWADETHLDLAEVPPDRLPDECLVFTLPSRYCPSDELADTAWQLFGALTPGWRRVQSIADFVNGHLAFRYGASTPLTTGADAYRNGEGVCRDFAHLFVTFCRALTIPTRYVFGYLPDIDVEPTDAPMDFAAWTEVYLGGRWWTFDPRNNRPRTGRVLIGRGRDALDVAMVTTYGAPVLDDMVVWAERVLDE